MPWELRIVRYGADGDGPLGDRQLVIDHLATVFPGHTFGPARLPPPEFLDKMSAEGRALFLKPELRLVYEEGGLSFEFWCPDRAEIACLHADVRGEGNPLPVLRRLCRPVGWTAFDLGDWQKHWRTASGAELLRRAAVDLDADYPRQWADFTRWLDDVIETTQPER